MSYREEALLISCGENRMLGILCRPEQDSDQAEVALLIVVGGPQYRVGSHRQFVQVARSAASAGFATLRFDFRGMGDSEGAQRSFESSTDDIAAALAALGQAVPRAKHFVLWGLCDGASAALLFLHKHQQHAVTGLILLNPWVRSEVSLAKAQVKHYYRQRLFEAAFWKKLISGKVAASAIAGFAANLRKAFAGRTSDRTSSEPYQVRMAQSWSSFEGQILLILSGRDLTAREFIEYADASADWTSAFAARPGTRLELQGADHTFSLADDSFAVSQATCALMARLRT